MPSAAFFFISKRFNEINVGRRLDKPVSIAGHSVEFVLRCDLDDIWGRPVDGCLVRVDVDTWIDDLGCRRNGTEMRLCNACGELGVGNERVSLSYRYPHVKRCLILRHQGKPRTCRDFLEPIHGVAVECFEHADLALLKCAFYKSSMCEELVGKVAVEQDTLSGEHPEEGYTC